MGEWRQVRLCDVFAADNRRLGMSATEPPVLSVTKHDGLVRADEFFGKRIASKKLNDYKVLAPGSWVFSTIHIDEGSIARSTLSYEGVVSPLYTTMRWIGTHHDPAYFELLLRAPQMLRVYHDRAQGSVNRRRSLPFKVFADLTVRVPSLPEQRRIVSLIQALDENVAALRTEYTTAIGVLHSQLNELWERSVTTKPMGSFASLASGPSWAASDERTTAEEGATPVVKITNTRSDGRLDLSDRLYVHGLPATTRVLDGRSLIIIRTNGNPQRIGNVYRPVSEIMGSAVSAFQFIVQADSVSLRDYLYWAVKAPHCQRLMTEATSGSTGLNNLAAKWLRSLEIPWRGNEERLEFVTRASTASSVADSLIAEADSLWLMRTSLLASLLSGSCEIPSTYDSILSGSV
jgi:type I restriction enzyme, S subunit